MKIGDKVTFIGDLKKYNPEMQKFFKKGGAVLPHYLDSDFPNRVGIEWGTWEHSKHLWHSINDPNLRFSS